MALPDVLPARALISTLATWRGEVASTSWLVGPLLVVLVVCLLAAARGHRPAAIALVPVGVLWLLFNGRLEGPVLISFDETHGATLSDLLAVLGFVLAARVLLRGSRASHLPLR